MTHYGKAAKAVLEDNCEGWEDIAPDETRNYNHTTCPAGEDKRERLGVKNIGNSWLWHCFNCGESGYYRPREVFSKLLESGGVASIKKPESVDPVIAYYMRDFHYEMFPIDQQLWLASYGFMQDDVEAIGIRTGPFGVYLPVCNNVKLVGYQVRNFTTGGPKYTTHTTRPVHYRTMPSDTLVIVEDLLSAYKVQLAGYSVCALMGTKLHVPVSELPHAKKLVIWLDEDSAGSSGAMHLHRDVAVLYEDSKLISFRQPKELSTEELQAWLTT